MKLRRRIIPGIAWYRDDQIRAGAAVIGDFHALRAKCSGGCMNALALVGVLGRGLIAAGRFVVTSLRNKLSEVSVELDVEASDTCLGHRNAVRVGRMYRRRGCALKLRRRMIPGITRHRDDLVRAAATAAIGDLHALRTKCSGSCTHALVLVLRLGGGFKTA